MLKLIMVTPREWKEGEVIKVKVVRIASQRAGVWELVLEEVKEVKS